MYSQKTFRTIDKNQILNAIQNLETYASMYNAGKMHAISNKNSKAVTLMKKQCHCKIIHSDTSFDISSNYNILFLITQFVGRKFKASVIKTKLLD